MDNDFGEYLTNLRERNNLSARKLSKMIDVSYSHISNIENGRRSANKEIIISISECLQLSPAERTKLFDLAAQNHTRPNNIPDDVSEYIVENNNLINIIRLAKALNYTDFEFDRLINFMYKKP